MSKLPNVGTTIFSVMSKLAVESNAINLSQGFPNFPIDPVLKEIIHDQVEQNVHQYMPMGGYPKLKEAVRELIKNNYQRVISSDNVLITAGATQAIFTTILGLIKEGDEVIILDPSYDCYEPAVILAGGKPIRIPLKKDFLPDWDLIDNHVNASTKMIITNNPHNPSGRTWDKNDVSALESIMLAHEQLLLLSDEVYEFISFERKHISIHTNTKIRDRAIIISSFGKTFHITGWKIGYLVTTKDLMNEITKVHQFNVFCVNSLAQACLAEYMNKVDVLSLANFYRQKRDLFRNGLINSNFQLLPCDGTYFQTVNYSNISNSSDVEFCKELTTKYGVAAIPISVFNKDGKDDQIIRFCFAKDDQTIQSAIEKLCLI